MHKASVKVDPSESFSIKKYPFHHIKTYGYEGVQKNHLEYAWSFVFSENFKTLPKLFPSSPYLTFGTHGWYLLLYFHGSNNVLVS